MGAFPVLGNVSCQEGYGAFSIGAAGIKATAAYIPEQEEHHRTRTFREELELFLQRNGVAYDASLLD